MVGKKTCCLGKIVTPKVSPKPGGISYGGKDRFGGKQKRIAKKRGREKRNVSFFYSHKGDFLTVLAIGFRCAIERLVRVGDRAR